MTDFLENVLSSMSSAFNSSPIRDGATDIDLNLNEDKTLKWRGLHNNQYARKNSRKTEIISTNENGPNNSEIKDENVSHENDEVLPKKEILLPLNTAEGVTETDVVVVDVKPEKQKKLKKSSEILKNRPQRRLRRSRTIESTTIETEFRSNTNQQIGDKLPPVKRRGRSKKIIEQQHETEIKQTKENGNEQNLTDNVDEKVPIISLDDKETTTSIDRKLRRSERNVSHDPVVAREIIKRSTSVDGLTTKQGSSIENGIEDDSSQKGKKLKRNIRTEQKTDDSSIEQVTSSNETLLKKDDDLKSELNKSMEEEKSSDEKLNIPRKRGRRSKLEIQDNNKIINSENLIDFRTPTKKTTRGTSKELNTENVQQTNLRKDKNNVVQQSATGSSSQRPLRRIKPTVKILENEELRYEFESKNIARLIPPPNESNDIIENNNGGKIKKESPNQSIASGSILIKKKHYLSGSNNLNVDNIYPIPLQKPCREPEDFLNEIKAAKINLHKSPEDKKLNRKQHKKLLKQKEKHFEKLGLKRNLCNDLTESENSSSDNDEFLPSKKINIVGKPNVTLRIRNNKENSLNLISLNENDCRKSQSQPQQQRKRTNSRQLSTTQQSITPKFLTTSNQAKQLKLLTQEIKKEPINMICLCHKPSQYYTRNTLETSFCCAIDNIEDEKVGCCNQLDGELLNLLRPSQRVGYMILCEDHKHRLRAHNCCAACGIFCTQGKFILCQYLHFFHPECAQKFIVNTPYDPAETNYVSPTLVLKCPHCGNDTPEKTSLVTMKCQTLPVFLPNQKSLIKPAKMSLPSTTGRRTSLNRRKLEFRTEFEKLIPESVMNVVKREKRSESSEFTSKDMFYSINNDDLERVAEIIASGYNVTVEMNEFLNGTCLHLVAHSGTIQMAYLLLCRYSSTNFLNMIDKELRTAIMCAVIGDKMDILKLFIQCGADVTIKGPDGMTCLHIAAKLGNLTAAQIIVESYKDITNIIKFENLLNSLDDGAWTAMVWAAENGHSEIVSFLINHGADTTICDTENNTVLHWATLSNRLETILILLQTNINCNVQNINGDTPLHIACRQSSTRISLMLIANGADLMVKNKAQELPYDCIPDEESKCARAVGFNMQMRTFGPTGLKTKIICNDISNGRESHPIQVVRCDRYEKTTNNDYDDEIMLPDFKYITKAILLQNSIQIDYRISQMRVCSCTDGCNSDQCQCSTISVQNWYTPEGRLNGEFNFDDPAMIFECNDVCGCNKLICKNRVVQNGTKIPLQIYECENRTKGWGVRSLIPILHGTFVAEYTGEILTDIEADRRTDDSYFFDLGSSEHCIDANYYGNISRFFNHSCSPNIIPVRVYFDHQDYRFPKIAFFASKDIPAGDEIAFDYGDKFWAVKQKYFGCKCLLSTCRYSSLIIDRII